MHDDPVELAAALIAIDSVNPSLVAGAAGEAAAAAFCAEWMRERGFAVTQVGTPDRPSLIGVRRGSGGGRSLMLNGHLDTVSAMSSQLVPEVRDGRLYGRGSFDMKGGVAALLVAAATAAPTRGDVIVTLVADEEFGSVGTEDVLSVVRANAAIVAEPSQLELTVAHRGFAWFELSIEGRAAHGSMPEQGIDAIAHAAAVMRELDGLRAVLEGRPAHPLLGQGTVRVATIAGGVDAATVAPSCILTIERRFLPGETTDDVEAELREAIGNAPGEGVVTLTRLVARGAFEADPDWPIMAAVLAQGQFVQRGEPFWTDAGLIVEAGIPCLVLGVAGDGAHADVEWASTASIECLTDIVRGTIEEFCA